MRTHFPLALLAAFIGGGTTPSLLAGCGGLPFACTEIGCIGSLAIAIIHDDGTPVAAFEGSAELSSGRVNFACVDGEGAADGYWCTETGVTLRGAEGDLELEVYDADDPLVRFLGELAPEYTEFQPNGPGCEPVCLSAEAEVVLEYEE